MKMGSAGLNNLFLLDQVKGHCGTDNVWGLQSFVDPKACMLILHQLSANKEEDWVLLS